MRVSESPLRVGYVPDRVETGAATAKLLVAAEQVTASPCLTLRQGGGSGGLAAFASLYREWLLVHRGATGSTAERHEKAALMLNCMAAASTLGEAIELLARFNGQVWGPDGQVELCRESGHIRLHFHAPARPGPPGLLNDIWELSFYLRQLEFLVGTRIEGVAGEVTCPDSLPSPTVTLLFDRSVTYLRPALALIMPERHLARAVVARADQIESFFEQYIVSAFSAPLQSEMKPLLASLLRDQTLRRPQASTSLERISARLGLSAATVRRRLTAEGASFRDIREGVLDDLAKMWLADERVHIAEIAQRLGYSDVFAFRRFFQRRNGCSPSAFRRTSSSQCAQRSAAAGIRRSDIALLETVAFRRAV